MMKVFKLINKYASAILMLLAIMLIFISIKNVMTLAHFPIKDLCAYGMKLITENTGEIEVSIFETVCERTVDKGKEIVHTVISASQLNFLVALFLMFISISIRKCHDNS